MGVFENLRKGQHYAISDPDYQAEVHQEINRSEHLSYLISQTDPNEQERILDLENQLLNDQMHDGTYFTLPFNIDCGSRVFLGKDVFANHDLDIMSAGTITIEDGVMMGPEVALLTVNHEPKNIRTVYTGEIHIKKNAWLGARVSVLPGVTIGENAIVGTGAVVTHDVPDNTIVAGVPARVIKTID